MKEWEFLHKNLVSDEGIKWLQDHAQSKSCLSGMWEYIVTDELSYHYDFFLNILSAHECTLKNFTKIN